MTLRWLPVYYRCLITLCWFFVTCYIPLGCDGVLVWWVFPLLIYVLLIPDSCSVITTRVLSILIVVVYDYCCDILVTIWNCWPWMHSVFYSFLKTYGVDCCGIRWWWPVIPVGGGPLLVRPSHSRYLHCCSLFLLRSPGGVPTIVIPRWVFVLLWSRSFSTIGVSVLVVTFIEYLWCWCGAVIALLWSVVGNLHCSSLIVPGGYFGGACCAFIRCCYYYYCYLWFWFVDYSTVCCVTVELFLWWLIVDMVDDPCYPIRWCVLPAIFWSFVVYYCAVFV